MGGLERCAKEKLSLERSEKSSAVYKAQLHTAEDFSSFLVRNDSLFISSEHL